MKKLTERQQKVLDYAKKQINRAKTCKDWIEYEYTAPYSTYSMKMYYPTYEDAKRAIIERNNELDNIYSESYDRLLKNQVLVTASTNTLKALEKLGLIKILEVGGNFPDLIEIIEA